MTMKIEEFNRQLEEMQQSRREEEGRWEREKQDLVRELREERGEKNKLSEKMMSVQE